MKIIRVKINPHLFKIKLLAIICILAAISFAQNKRKLDSLQTILKTSKIDTVKINAHIQIVNTLMKADTISGYRELRKVYAKLNTFSDFNNRALERLAKICYNNDMMQKSRLYYDQGLTKSKQKNNNYWIARYFLRIADLLQQSDHLKQSIIYFDSAIVYSPKTNEPFLAKVYMLKGRAFYDGGDYKPAMDDYIIAQRLFEKNNLQNVEYGHLLHFIGSVFKRQNFLDKALDYYLKELDLAIKIKDSGLEAEALYLCAGMYGEMGNLDKELEYELKALEMFRAENNQKAVALMLGNISVNYSDRKDYKKAIEYCEQALEIYQSMNEIEQESWVYKALGNYYSKIGKHKLGIDYLKKAMETAMKVETKQLLNKADITQSMAFAYAGMGNYQSAFNLYLDYQHLNDSLTNQGNKEYLSTLEKQYDTEKKEKEIALLNKDKEMHQTELAKQATQRNALILGITLVMIIAGISIMAFINNRKKSKLLSLQVNEINYQNSVIKEKNKDITDSIVYAKRLQEAVFPSTNDLNNYFAESFVLFRPKDIVSGDFYWFEQVGDKTIFIVGDSTGHGVPGAFMSILGHNLLNQIILEEKITEPSEILSLLDKRVTSALNKKSSKQEYNDGMDIGVCVINKKTNKLYYAGANRPLIIKRGDRIFDLKQNKFAIGGINTNEAKVFMQHEMETKENDTLYLFSDGYYDQFGGPKGKKFKFKQLQDLLLANAHKPMTEQMDLLNRSFENWMGNLEQIDDVCVVGIRL